MANARLYDLARQMLLYPHYPDLEERARSRVAA
jgi:hypothetical protein